jgi:ABC-type molybdenum transport system ATPase subunit/photorepair protein PhrA
MLLVGLDPIVTKHISSVLYRLAEAKTPRIVLSLRPQDDIPEWVTHLVYAGEDGIVNRLGPKEEVLSYLKDEYKSTQAESATNARSPNTKKLHEVGRLLYERDAKATAAPLSNAPVLSRDGYEKIDKTRQTINEPLVEMEGVRIAYGQNSVLGEWEQDKNGVSESGLHWTVHRGERWGIFGANGSGKTTLLSLVTSDHPQTYSAPVKLFQRSRLPEPGVPGITIFEIQARMGHASPEVHALFPKRLSVRATLESAWSDTPITKPRLDELANKKIDVCLKWFEREIRPSFQTEQQQSHQSGEHLEWAKDILFGEISFSAQRVLLFLRATIRNPDIVILDEAFSGMDDLVRDKCLLFLSRGETMELGYTDAGPRPVETQQGDVVVPGLQEHQALLCVSHSRQEVPGCVREWVCLPEPGTGPPRFGRFDGPIELDARRWGEVWGEV